MPISQIAFALLFIESSINITYYKDCIFAFCVFTFYFGMLWVNWSQKKKNIDILGVEDLSGIFDNKEQKIKYRDADLICHWLIAFGCLTFVFLLITLISDWNSVFYRKAIIYKQRAARE